MEHTLDGIRWCYEYQNEKIWLNDDWIAANSQERVLSITVNIFNFMSKPFSLCEAKIGHNSETLTMKAVVSVAARRCAILSSEYYIQSIWVRQIIYAI